ncbi:unnamed protein product [Musa acuminata var. zebrina]
MASGLINANPVVYERKERQVRSVPTIIDEDAEELIDQQEIFDILIFRTLLIIFFWGLCEQRVNSNTLKIIVIFKIKKDKESSNKENNMGMVAPWYRNCGTSVESSIPCSYKGRALTRFAVTGPSARCVTVRQRARPQRTARPSEKSCSDVLISEAMSDAFVYPSTPGVPKRYLHRTSSSPTGSNAGMHAFTTLILSPLLCDRSELMKSMFIICIGYEVLDIQDPEHPYTLEELKVVTEDSIEVNDKQSHVSVTFTPTVEHCSLATTIGLCLRVKLMRSLPSRYKVDIRVAPGTHATEAAVNKQLNDKERVVAALENPNLMYMIDRCLEPTFYY